LPTSVPVAKEFKGMEPIASALRSQGRPCLRPNPQYCFRNALTLATPVIVSQDRGYRESYARADLAGHHGHHDWKAGLDSIFSPVHEMLAYRITDPAQFDPATQQQFQFSGRRWDIEPSVYAQDQMHLGKWNVSAGLRFDHYRLVASESAWRSSAND